LVNTNSEMRFNYNYYKTILGTYNIEIRERKRTNEKGFRRRNVCIIHVREEANKKEVEDEVGHVVKQKKRYI